MSTSIQEDESMANKHRAACEEIRRRGLCDFLDWLRENYTFAEYGTEGFDILEPTHDSSQTMLEAFFEIDMDAVERFRRRLIEDLQSKVQERRP